MRVLWLALVSVGAVLAASPKAYAQGVAQPGGRVLNQPSSLPKPQVLPTPSPESEETRAQKQGFLPKSITNFANTEEAKTDFVDVCKNIRITKKEKIDLTSMENRLICGDPQDGEIGTPWSQIPPNEAAYFLKGFLQTRGYHQPEFIQDGLLLFVRVGPISTLKRLEILGGPPGFQPPRRRLVQGEPLTPDMLNDLDAWALSLMKNEGYACAETETRADPELGEVVVFVKPNGLRRIRSLEEAGDTGLREGALNRYNAFLMNDIYRERWVALTRRRTQDDGFLQTMVLTTKCEEGDAVSLIRDVNLGPSRVIRIGVGGSTAEGGRVQAVIRRNRIGTSASSAQASVRLSYLEKEINRQTASGNFRWYYLHGEERYSLRPEITFEHLSQPTAESNVMLVKFLHGWTFETTNGQWDLRAGPDYQYEDQQRVETPKTINIAYLELGARWTDHDFEWFTPSPRTGKSLEATLLGAHKDAFSDYNVQRFDLQGQKLWTIGHSDPPFFILGTRFNVGSVFAESNEIQSRLPLRFLSFLGGERDLRGYRYQSVQRNGSGALSHATVSLEGRFHRVIFKRADVFGFIDSGLLGDRNFGLTHPLYLSPGLGLRWESPVGTLRGYVAQSMAVSNAEVAYPNSVRLGITFGEEF